MEVPFKDLLLEIHAPEYVSFIRNEYSDTDHPGFSHDTSSPMQPGVGKAAIEAIQTALTATSIVLETQNLAYALMRPPGHHASKHQKGGFCYFNNAALAAHRLSKEGKVAVLDLDFHHGNGTQAIFYDRADVLTVSLHADPSCMYPFDSGFVDETGTGNGLGFNLNIPLPDYIQKAEYAKALSVALDRIRTFRPEYLVVALGFDTYHRDLLGTFSLELDAYAMMGEYLNELKLPTLVTLEGGYHQELGETAVAFFKPWVA